MHQIYSVNKWLQSLYFRPQQKLQKKRTFSLSLSGKEEL